MSYIDDFKLADLPKRITTLPDTVRMKPDDLKKHFDGNAVALMEKHNGLVDFLKDSEVGKSAAAEIGSEAITDLHGTTVRSQVVSLKEYVDGISIAHLPNGGVSEEKLSELLQRALFHVGDYKWRSMPSPMAGWLLCDGSQVSRADYGELFDYLNPSLGECKISIASPAVVAKEAHGLRLGDGVYFTTDGGLPGGISPDVRYWAIPVNTDTFQIALSYEDALSGAGVGTEGEQNGVHILRRSPYGIGDGVTTFDIPDLKGRAMVGVDSSGTDPQTEFALAGQLGGEKAHALTEEENGVHTHTAATDSKGGHAHTGSAASAGEHGHSGSLASTAGSHTHGGGIGWAGDHAHNTGFPNYYQFRVGTGVNAYVSDSSDGPYPTGAYHDRTSSTGGGHAHSLTINNGGDHSHTVSIASAAAHTHTLTVDSAGAHTHNVTVASSLGGRAHNNLQPYVTGYCFIKY